MGATTAAAIGPETRLMRDASPKPAKMQHRRLPKRLELGSLRQFSKLQPPGEKNRHPLERGVLGILRQKQGLKRDNIYYISITYSKAAKLGTLRWHPSSVGTLRKPPFSPEGCQTPEGCQALTPTPATSAMRKRTCGPTPHAVRRRQPMHVEQCKFNIAKILPVAFCHLPHAASSRDTPHRITGKYGRYWRTCTGSSEVAEADIDRTHTKKGK